MDQLALTFAPHENSFRRLTPRAHAPSSIAWGYENRTVAVRIPGGPHEARRIEHRVAGADANPYLVLASILGGALLGIQRELKPPMPVTGDAYVQTLPKLPPDWASAIAAFAHGDLISEIYSGRLSRMLVNCKEQELSYFRRQVSNFEYDTYLETV
jgi:glutamine synthetase